MNALRRLLVPLFALTFAAPLGAATTPIEPWRAISYREWPEGGPFQVGGRPLGTGGNKLFTIDVNSRVDIVFDDDILKQQLGPLRDGSGDEALQLWLRNLTEAVDNLSRAYQATVDAWEAYQRLPARGAATDEEASAKFRRIVTEATTWQNSILDPLQKAIQKRLEAAGKQPEAAKKDAEEVFDEIILGERDLYDWVALRDLLSKEILLAERALAEQQLLSLELQADWISTKGTKPLRLPGWNNLEASPNQPFRKLSVVQAAAAPEESKELKQAVEKANEAGKKAAEKAPQRGDQPRAAGALLKVTEAAQQPLRVPETPIRRSTERPPDTHFDLLSAGVPQPGDRVDVQVSVFRGATEDGKLKDSPAIISWIDSFEIGSFGIQDTIVSSLAFAQQEAVDDWKPAATVSWILSSRRWPQSDAASRLRINRFRPLSGIGISASALDFVEDTDIEIGFAPTVSFLNDFLLFGYGWNLQAEEERGYWFLSVRILKGQGILERFEPKKKTGGGS